MCAKAFELGMVPVALGLSAQYGSGEKRLAPQRDQALPVEIAGVDRPKAHADPRLK
jgi:hypothetical protein